MATASGMAPVASSTRLPSTTMAIASMPMDSSMRFWAFSDTSFGMPSVRAIEATAATSSFSCSQTLRKLATEGM